ncbi:choice-of-anchor Q domain-containing protein [Mesobacterium pallidum]|uniref:choice-of-anchor Q domain-containing protein n=1 Tax=Mesobacterium pallidum TaxID=2872037 RepID=UPI001EE24690|nr:choice-of-anchor Q domain-containing protein [Mesobacterium pallidum]
MQPFDLFPILDWRALLSHPDAGWLGDDLEPVPAPWPQDALAPDTGGIARVQGLLTQGGPAWPVAPIWDPSSAPDPEPAAPSGGADLADPVPVPEPAPRPAAPGDVSPSGVVHVVDTMADVIDGSDGRLSLREAIVGAAAGDRITFAFAGTITLTLGQITLAEDLILDGDVDGDDVADVRLDGAGGQRVMSVTAAHAEIDAMILSGGVTSGFGGGLFVSAAAHVRLANAVVEGNSADEGGGIYAEGDIDIIASTIADNIAGRYGGLALRGQSVLAGSLVATNVSEGRGGGGIHVSGSTADLSMVNTTVWGNIAVGSGQDEGGGLRVESQATAEIHSSTFTGNAAVGGGGIHAQGQAGLLLSNSIVLGNVARDSGSGHDIFTQSQGGGDPILSFGGVNLVGDGPSGGSDLTGYSPGDVFETLALVPTNTSGGGSFSTGALAQNGGRVQTVALSSTGVAVDMGLDSALPVDTWDLDGDLDTAEALPVDARGPGFARVDTGGLDIGAFEVNYSGPVLVFEGALADGAETVTLLEASAAGTVVFDVDANDGEGGATDAGLAFALVAGNTDRDGDALLPFAIDAATGIVTVVDPGDLETALGSGFTVTVRVSDTTGSGNPAIQADLTITLDPRPVSLVVDSLSDAVDGDYSAGNLSLREAVDLVATGGTITFDAALAGQSIQLAGDQLSILRGVTIDGDVDGDRSGDVTVVAAAGRRIFEVFAQQAVTLAHLELTGGTAGEGGAIRSAGDTDLTVLSAHLHGNAATGQGGAIHAEGNLTVVNSTLSGNSAQQGGAISVHNFGLLADRDIRVTLTQATIAGNSAEHYGAMSIEDSNSTPGSSTHVAIQNSTVAGNVATVGTGAVWFRDALGDGSTTNVRMVIENSVFANEFDSAAPEIVAENAVIEAHYSVFAGDLDLTDTPATTLTSILSAGDPSLGALQDNGGPAPTMMPLFGSLLVNGGSDLLLPLDLYDLDGDGVTSGERLPRDATGSDRVAGPAVDIGAVERVSPAHLVVDTLVDEFDGDVSAENLSLREALALVADGGLITFDAALAGGTIMLNGTELSHGRGITIDGDAGGAGGVDITLDAGGLSRVMTSGGGTLDSLVITGGTLTDGGNDGELWGGGIQHTSFTRELVIRDSHVTGNRVHDTRTGTTWDSGGGGISTFGPLTLVNSTVSDNAVITDLSPTAGSSASMRGGGILGVGTTLDDRVTLINTTLADNRIETTNSFSVMPGAGSAIITYGSAELRNATITGNHAVNGGANGLEVSVAFSGISSGGFGPATLEMANSIVSGNASDSVYLGPELTNTSFLGGNIKDGGLYIGTTLVQPVGPGVVFAGLSAHGGGQLADNGGGVPTVALALGGLAVDAGAASELPTDRFDLDGDADTAEALPVDARGAGFARVIGAEVDLGAAELDSMALVVSTTDDVDDGNYAVGRLSLREAAMLAETHGGGRITFAPGLAGATIQLTGRIDLADGVEIDGDIDGDDKADVVISGGGGFGIFGGQAGRVTLRSLTLEDGNAGIGGAILLGSRDQISVAGIDWTIIDSTLRGNQAVQGGAIAAFEANLALVNTTLHDNTAQDGAGLYAGFDNGGVIDDEVSERFVLVNTTLAENTATGQGGGIWTELRGFEIHSATIAGNHADGGGGGISLITDRFDYSSEGRIVTNSVIATNTAGAGQARDVELREFGSLRTDDSLIGNVESVGLGFVNSVGMALNGLDPVLGALGDNGGPVPTMLPLLGSPLINTGDAFNFYAELRPSTLVTDRFDLDGDDDTDELLPVDATGGPRIVGSALDIGAAEAQATPPKTVVVDTLVDEVDGDYSAGDLSLREALMLVDTGGTVTFASGLAGGTIDLALGQVILRRYVTIDGDVTGDDKADITLDAGGLSRAIDVRYAGVFLNSLEITGGFVDAPEDFGRDGGAGIRNIGGNLWLDHVWVHDNHVAIDGGDAVGGGIANYGGIRIWNSTISDNSVTSTGAVMTFDTRIGGGGYYNGGPLSELAQVTIADNQVTRLSTASDPDGLAAGGGVFEDEYSILSNATVTGNTAITASASGDTLHWGDGVFLNHAGDGSGDEAFIDIVSSIVAGNGQSDVDDQRGGAFFGEYLQLNDNIIGAYLDNIGPAIALDDIFREVSGGRARLTDTGGAVPTIALKAGGAAIDQGNEGQGPTDPYDLDNDLDYAERYPLDARGLGYLRQRGEGIDIGAVEYQPLAPGTFAETGTVDLQAAAQTITLRRSYDTPVVVAHVASQNGGQPVAVRIDQIAGDSLTLRLQEPGNLDGNHVAETVTYLVAEAGSWMLPDGTLFEAGLHETGRLTSAGFEPITFERGFETTPAILSQVQSANGPDFVVTRQQDATTTGFSLALQEEEATNGGGHKVETVGWIALTPGAWSQGPLDWQAGSTGGVNSGGATVALSPGFDTVVNPIAQLSTFGGSDPAWARGTGAGAGSFSLFAEEDTSADAETFHGRETVDWFVFSEPGTLAAQAARPVLETGTLSLRHLAKTVTLENSYENPVVIAHVATESGGAPVTVRVDAIAGNSLTLRLQEPGNLDGSHAAETVHYMVVEAGSWVLGDGTRFEAGVLTGNKLTSAGFDPVAFATPFGAAPVVLSQVQSANGADFVVSRQRATTADGFELSMQEEEALNGGGHKAETLGWVAFEPGSGASDGLPWVAGRTAGVTHLGAEIAVPGGAFGGSTLAQVSTFGGADPAWARGAGTVLDGFIVSVEEDTSADSETNHVGETVDWIAFGGTGVVSAFDHAQLTGGPAPNRPPVANADVATAVSAEVVLIDVLANDSDPDGDPLTVTRIVTAPQLGGVEIAPDGTISYFAPVNGSLPRTDSFTYEIGDDRGGFDTAEVTVNIGPSGTVTTLVVTELSDSEDALRGGAFAPGDDGTFYVFDNTGVIRAFDLATGTSQVFGDLSGSVASFGIELGLLGLAFHPDHATNGRLYAVLTEPDGIGPPDIVLRSYEVSATDGTLDVLSAEEILRIDNPYDNHNGGGLAFGPDGYLYLSLGDGGGADDPLDNGQDAGTLLGTVLRLDVDNPSGGRAYGIPAGNPFADSVAGAPEVHVYGLRNPLSLGFDAAGRLLVPEWGETAQSELNILDPSEAGANLGWNLFEGDAFVGAGPEPERDTFRFPSFVYGHDEGSIPVGGAVLDDGSGLSGAVVVGDFESGRLWAVRDDPVHATEFAQTGVDALPDVTAIVANGLGALYATSLSGGIYEIAGWDIPL